MLGLAAATLAVSCAVAAPARAEPAPSASLATETQPSERSAPGRRWYGWQTLAIDGAAIGVGLTGAHLLDDHRAAGVSLGATGLLGYSFSGPLVHWAHDRRGAAALSLALRVGLPLVSVGVLSGESAGRCPGVGARDDERYCERIETTLLVAASLSMLAASIVDAAVLGWEPPTPTPTPAPARLELMPLLAWDGRRGGTAGLCGSF